MIDTALCSKCGSVIVQSRSNGLWLCRNIFCRFSMEPHPSPTDNESKGERMNEQIKVYGNPDERTVEQLERCVQAVEGARGVLCADSHVGYSQPIGGGVAYPDHISPSGVGYDIACGNKAAKTPLRAEDVDVAGVMDEIVTAISFGMGRANKEPVDHPVLDHIREAAFAPQRQLYDLAAKQLGTVGAGNHYVDLFSDEDGFLWVGVHFGSRGFGHKTASGFLALAQGKQFDERAKGDEMDAPPTLLGTETDLGQSYVDAMSLAGEYAYAGRDWVVGRVLRILGTSATDEIHNHHNFAWHEDDAWVVRKGCTPAYPGQRGFVGGSMGDISVILEGVESDDADAALHSTVHGAGRVMSRTQAAGKMRPVYDCTERDCEHRMTRGEYRVAREKAGVSEQERFTTCPDHPEGKMKKHRARVKEGLIDWPGVQAELTERGIVLRGGAADEAPGAYKHLPDVLDAHSDSIRILHTLTPLGVAMAGPDTVDPFRD